MRNAAIGLGLTLLSASCLLDRSGTIFGTDTGGGGAGVGGAGVGGLAVVGGSPAAGGMGVGAGGVGSGGDGGNPDGGGGSNPGGMGGFGGATGGGGAGGCGDGVLDAPAEECDDGNTLSGDNCSMNCLVECDGGGQQDPTTFHCYRLFSTEVVWQTASDSCAVLGTGYALLTISSFAERNFIDDDVDSGTGVWTAGNDLAMEGTFVWSNGEPWSDNYWDAGEPAGMTSQNCVRLSALGGDSNDRLRDTDCAETRPYVCELTPAGTP